VKYFLPLLQGTPTRAKEQRRMGNTDKGKKGGKALLKNTNKGGNGKEEL
jgi:hypothetical protein